MKKDSHVFKHRSSLVGEKSALLKINTASNDTGFKFSIKSKKQINGNDKRNYYPRRMINRFHSEEHSSSLSRFKSALSDEGKTRKRL